MKYEWNIKSAVFSLVAVLTITFSGLPVLATEKGRAGQPVDGPSATAMIVDAALGRPFGLAATVLGAGIFLVSLPFSALGGNSDKAFEKLVVAPGRFTFARPLGEGTQPDPH